MRSIAVISQKGGVGKTTTSLNLSHALVLGRKKVLAIDMDPQANLSMSLGIQSLTVPGCGDILLDGFKPENAVVTLENGIDLIPAGAKLGELEFVTEGGAERGFRLENAMKQLQCNYDFVIIDCPPSAGLLGMNALLAAKELIVPVSSDFLSMQGLSRTVEIIRHIESELKRKFVIWILMTRFYRRRRLVRDVFEKIDNHFPNQMFQTQIRESVSLAESPSYGKTIFEYKKLSHGAEDYLSMAKDLIQRCTV